MQRKSVEVKVGLWGRQQSAHGSIVADGAPDGTAYGGRR